MVTLHKTSPYFSRGEKDLQKCDKVRDMLVPKTLTDLFGVILVGKTVGVQANSKNVLICVHRLRKRESPFSRAFFR